MSEFYMKVAGVTFGGRQRTVARLRSGQELVLFQSHQIPMTITLLRYVRQAESKSAMLQRSIITRFFAT